LTSESFIDRFYHRNPKIDPLLAGKICLQLSNSKDIKGQQQHKQLKLLFYQKEGAWGSYKTPSK
jgi:hypothetical protein